MNVIALAIITATSAISSLFGLIWSWYKARRKRPKTPKVQLTITLEEDGREVEYRVESDSRQEAEEEIKGIIERGGSTP